VAGLGCWTCAYVLMRVLVTGSEMPHVQAHRCVTKASIDVPRDKHRQSCVLSMMTMEAGRAATFRMASQ
jgi:hypothetical protein